MKFRDILLIALMCVFTVATCGLMGAGYTGGMLKLAH